MNAEPLLQIEGSVATITLQRPASANRLGPSDLKTLRRHIADINAFEPVTVLRIMATGANFCSGYDLAALGQDQAGADDFGEMVDAIEMARPVSIAGINGGVYGGGTDLCLACDFRIGVAGSAMQMPAARLGVHLYRSGLERYVSRLGIDNAKRLLLAADKLDAQQMLAIGFINQLVEPEALQGSVDALTQRLAQMAPMALLSMKRHLNAIARNQLDLPALERDIASARSSPDAREAMQAWRERRSPVFVRN